MKVKWQSDAPNMELVIPKGQYLPYELPVATKEVLGGVKVDGDTINITSDGVISTQKVDLSGVATKVELEEVENKIPDISGLATKSELATVESKIPDTSGLATKIELTAVENKIPDVSDFATKDEIPNVSGLATKVELNEVAATIPNSDDLATKAELDAVQSSIPDTSGLATKVELSNVEAKIPDTSGLATKNELNLVENKIPSIEGLATKNELDLVENKIPDVSNFVIHKELTDAITEVEGKIPDTTGLATKVELQTVEGSIPSEYLKNASVADNKLTITKSSGDTIEFSGGSSSGGGVQLKYNISSTATFTEQDKEVMKSAIKFGTGFFIDGCKVIRIMTVGSSRYFVILNPNGATDNHVIAYQVDIDDDMNVTSSVFTKFIDYVLVGSNSAISGDIITSDNWQTYIDIKTSSEWIKAADETDGNLYNAKYLWVAASYNNNYYQGIFRFGYDSNGSEIILGDYIYHDLHLGGQVSVFYNGGNLILTVNDAQFDDIYYIT